MDHLEDSTSYNAYPFELLVGRISTYQFGSVDVENNFVAKLDLTKFGEVLRSDLVDSISRAGNFDAVGEGGGGMYLDGSVLDLLASNSFSCAGMLVEAAVAVSMLPHRGGSALWEDEYRHTLCFRYSDYDFSQLGFTDRYIKAFSFLSNALSQVIADDIGQSAALMSATENVLGVNVYSAEESAANRRQEAAESLRQQQLITANNNQIETINYPNGNVYVGEVRNGLFNGLGTFTFASGSVYVGEYRDGQRNGQGTFTIASGSVYVGEFRDGQYNGQGTLTSASGSVYVGEYRDGQRNGQGTYTSAGGRVQNGIWRDNGLITENDN